MPDDSFDAVYYSSPVPTSRSTLAVIALVFDRVHFPGVYIPQKVDLDATRAFLDRLKEDKTPQRAVRAEVLNCLICAVHRPHLEDFCVFGGEQGHAGILEPGTNQLVKVFEEAIYGPPAPNFFPMYDMGFNFPLLVRLSTASMPQLGFLTRPMPYCTRLRTI